MLDAGHEVTGVDVDEVSISFCRENYTNSKARFIVADVQDLFLGEHFDLIVASEVLEHLVYPWRAINVFERHLIKNGMLILTVPNGYCLWEIVIGKIGRKIRDRDACFPIYDAGRQIFFSFLDRKGVVGSLNTHDLGHVNFFSFAELSSILSQHGFDVISVEKQGLITSLLPLRQIEYWVRAEDTFARYLPPPLCGWWGLITRKK